MNKRAKRLNLIFNCDNWSIIDVDADASHLFDCTVEQMLGKDVRDFLPKYEATAPADGANNRWSGDIITKGRKRDGTPVRLIYAAKNLVLGTSNVTMIELHDQFDEFFDDTVARHFRQMISTSNENFWLTDASGEMPIYISPSYEKIFGRSVKSLLTNPEQFYSFVHVDDREKLIALVKQTKYTGVPGEMEYRIHDSSGRLRWLWVRLTPLRDEDNRTLGICGVTADVTDKKVAEVRIGEFHSTLSHELRTPLTSIKASLILIKRAQMENKWERFEKLQTIALDETERLIRLVSDFAGHQKNRGRSIQISEIEI